MDKDTLKEYLLIQQTAYKDATSLLFDSLNKRIDDQNTKLYDLQKSLEFSQEELRMAKNEIKICKNEVKEQAQQLEECKIEIVSLNGQLAKHEDYSRRKNIRIDGMEEEKQENWEQTQNKVNKLMKEKMELENIQVEYAHRINKRSNSKGPRTIIARLHHDTDKNKTLKNSHKLKGTKIFINEDLSERTLNIRKEKLPELKAARSKGKIAYFDREKLIIREKRIEYQQQSKESSGVDDSNRRVSTLVNVFNSSPLPLEDRTSNSPSVIGTTSPVSSRLRLRSDNQSY